MLRIFSSLPRTHRLLLLPVTAMVGVLGAHQLYQNTNTSATTDATVADLQKVTQPVSLALAAPQEQARVFSQPTHLEIAGALALASPAADRRAQSGELNVSQALAVASNLAAINAGAALNGGKGGDENERVIARADHVTGMGDGIDGHTSYVDNFNDDDTGDFADDSLDGQFSLGSQVEARETYVPEWQTYKVQQGDTFAELAEHSLGMGYSEVLELLDDAPDRKALTNLRVGNELDYKVDQDGHLLALRVMKNTRSGYLFERDSTDERFAINDIERTGEATQRLFAGTVNGSFGSSARATGLSSGEVAELISVLGKKVNFNRSARDGDRFQVLIESDVIDGKPYDSRILAAHYEGKDDLTVVRHDGDYYTPDGHGLDPAFNRYPFKGHYRISSPFNLKRHHPITGRISPHKGTDFAMPVGSTVRAPADGRVTKVVNHPLAGKYIVITHDNGYQTRYLHLSKPEVKPGQRVKMGQEIAKSGNTGRSTGAHLHYEIIANGSQVNAMRVKLPGGRALSGQELASFKTESKELLAKLETADNTRAVAQVRHDRKDKDDES
ncbi:murein DD-endopeptidase [Kushneria avicenniae]|uniref:Murein DD-endopeptidase n=1 Tax=Kushneria avicenniae TaxID=402385 RepID=A0A1I1GL82_9GAMM|nr:peptidoglycan DD-metalloendopeptidase family protein [Kushneria avicenniae]SFC12529.1 murein DD-endopeptidase [Kushneria avicenniae]